MITGALFVAGLAAFLLAIEAIDFRVWYGRWPWSADA